MADETQKKKMQLYIGEILFQELPSEIEPPQKDLMISLCLRSPKEPIAHLFRFQYIIETDQAIVFSLFSCKSITMDEWEPLRDVFDVLPNKEVLGKTEKITLERPR